MRDHYRSKQNFLVSETIGPGGGVPVAYALVFVLFDRFALFSQPFYLPVFVFVKRNLKSAYMQRGTSLHR
jgi:hypothetical protein